MDADKNKNPLESQEENQLVVELTDDEINEVSGGWCCWSYSPPARPRGRGW